MSTLVVKHAFSDSGNCREYYWVTTIKQTNQENKQPNKFLICSQDEGHDFGVQWYRATNDGCWYEPESLIKSSFSIITESGEILR